MIFDGENMFYNKTALSAATLESDVVNVGVGESYEPMNLVALVEDGEGDNATATITLQTCASEDFATPTTLGTYDKIPLSVPMPRGNLGYLRLSTVSTYTGGTITAGLVVDVDIKHRS